MDLEHEKRLADVENKAKSNTRRIEKIEKQTEALDSTDGKSWPVRGAYRFRLPNGADITAEVKTALGITEG